MYPNLTGLSQFLLELFPVILKLSLSFKANSHLRGRSINQSYPVRKLSHTNSTYAQQLEQKMVTKFSNPENGMNEKIKLSLRFPGCSQKCNKETNQRRQRLISILAYLKDTSF